ncbi:MAG TPA: hypothetical protein VFZ01_07495 [Geminicoccaceae bacterium]
MRQHLIAAALGVALATGPGGPVAAQERGALREGVAVQIDRMPGGPPEAGAGGQVDERALRYHAAQYDYAAVDREIARLRALHPGWEPPRDLFGGAARQPAEIDVSGLWATYERGDFAALRRDIEALRRINPAWQPPAKLVDLMAAAETRAMMKAAVAAGDWQKVVVLAERNPEVVNAEPQYIENLWMAAEAHYRLGDAGRAYDLYRAAWAGGIDPDQRLSTLQKGLANRDDRRLQELIALEADQPRDAAQEARFAEIRRDFAGGGPPNERSRLGLALAKVSAGDVDADELAPIEEEAEALRHGDAAQVLGWYHYEREDWPAAERWFERSLAWQPSGAAAEGLARTLMAVGEKERAAEIARAWSGREPKLAAVLSDLEGSAAVEGGSPRQRLAATMQLIRRGGRVDPGVLVAHGWALYELERVSEAAAAFERAREAATGRPAARGDATYGLAHAHVARGLTEEARLLLREEALTASQRAGVEEVLARREAVDAYRAGHYERSLELVRMLRSRAGDDASLAALEAWNLLELGDVSEARAIFAGLHASFPTAETKAGLKAVLGRQYPGSTHM